MSFFSTLKSMFGFGTNGVTARPGDRLLPCDDCRKDFVFDAGEQKFFKSKGFTDPKRCPHCRKHVKVRMKKRKRPSSASRNNGSSYGRGRSRRRSPRADSPYADE